MSANPKYEAFLYGLLDATKDGKVEWRDTADEDTFMVELNHGFVHLERRPNVDEDDRPYTYFRAYLYDRKGRLADEISSGQMTSGSMLTELYELARRSARETDSLLDQVSADLQTRGSR
jgi:hypothetical protein